MEQKGTKKTRLQFEPWKGNSMEKYDTVYAELDCPFCGKQYRYTPMTWKEAEREVKASKQNFYTARQIFVPSNSNLQIIKGLYEKKNDVADMDAWIESYDSSLNIEAYRTQRYHGLAEIRIYDPDSSGWICYLGEKLGKYFGHYYIPASFTCGGYSHEANGIQVKVWLEIENRKLKAALVVNPETGLVEKEAHHPPDG